MDFLEKLDKDIVRSFIVEKCDPYNEPLPDIPDKLIKYARSAYCKFYNMLTDEEFDQQLDNRTFDSLEDTIDNYFNEYHDRLVVIFSGFTPFFTTRDQIGHSRTG